MIFFSLKKRKNEVELQCVLVVATLFIDHDVPVLERTELTVSQCFASSQPPKLPPES